MPVEPQSLAPLGHSRPWRLVRFCVGPDGNRVLVLVRPMLLRLRWRGEGLFVWVDGFGQVYCFACWAFIPVTELGTTRAAHYVGTEAPGLRLALPGERLADIHARPYIDEEV